MRFLFMGILERESVPKEVRKFSASQGPHSEVVCPALSEDLCRKVVTNARVRLQEFASQNGGHIEHVLYKEQISSLRELILYQMSNAFVIIKMCYMYNQWYDISCATLYNMCSVELLVMEGKTVRNMYSFLQK